MKAKGFTLIEVLVALAILGIVLGMLAGTFQMAIRTWQRGDRIVEEHEAGRMAYEQLAQDLRSAFLSTEDEDIAFIGGRDELTFVCTIRGPITPYLAWRQVTYFLDPEKGLSMREEFPGPIAPEGGEPRPAMVVDPLVTGLSFRYGGAPDEVPEEGTWTESWDSWEKERLPQAVEVELRYGKDEPKVLEEPASRTFTISLPGIVGGEGAEFSDGDDDERDEPAEAEADDEADEGDD